MDGIRNVRGEADGTHLPEAFKDLANMIGFCRDGYRLEQESLLTPPVSVSSNIPSRASTCSVLRAAVSAWAVCLRARARPAMLARSIVEIDGSRTPFLRRVAMTPLTITSPLSVAHAAFAAASIMAGMSARVGARTPSRSARLRAWSVMVCSLTA
jgi:hypothetical protein